MWQFRLSLCFLLLPATAFAYTDPGSGILLWQGMIAVAGVVLVAVRNPGQFFRSMLQRLKSSKDSAKSTE